MEQPRNNKSRRDSRHPALSLSLSLSLSLYFRSFYRVFNAPAPRNQTCKEKGRDTQKVWPHLVSANAGLGSRSVTFDSEGTEKRNERIIHRMRTGGLICKAVFPKLVPPPLPSNRALDESCERTPPPTAFHCYRVVPSFFFVCLMRGFLF